MAISIGDSLDVSPWDSLIVLVKRCAGIVAWLDMQLTISEQEDIARYTEAMAARELDEESKGPLPRAGPSAATLSLLQVSLTERKQWASVAKMAIDAGVAERWVRSVENEGKVLSDAIIAGLNAVELPMRVREQIIAAAYKQLTGGEDMPVIEGSVG
jgi:hypothetical protein